MNHRPDQHRAVSRRGAHAATDGPGRLGQTELIVRTGGGALRTGGLAPREAGPSAQRPPSGGLTPAPRRVRGTAERLVPGAAGLPG